MEENKKFPDKTVTEKYKFAIGGKKTSTSIVLPLTLKTRFEKASTIKIQFITAILTTTFVAFLFSIVLRNYGNHGVLLLTVEIIIFSAYLIFSAKFIDMTFANLWVYLSEGGVKIIIEEDGILDSRISKEKISFSIIKSAKILSMPLPGTGGVLINIPKNKIEIRNFRFFYRIYGIYPSNNFDIFIETKNFPISSADIAENIIKLLQDYHRREHIVQEIDDV